MVLRVLHRFSFQAAKRARSRVQSFGDPGDGDAVALEELGYLAGGGAYAWLDVPKRWLGSKVVLS